MDLVPKSRIDLDTAALGFRPDLVFPVVGVTFEGRQQVLAEASGLLVGGRISTQNGLLTIVAEPSNKFDPDAVSVSLRVDGALRPAGYVPKKWCPTCGTALPARDYNTTECLTCGRDLTGPEAFLNRYIKENYLDKGFVAGVSWIGNPVGTWAMRVGITRV